MNTNDKQFVNTNDSNKSSMKDMYDFINRECIICSKKDTDTIPLRQCMGCSYYCYCKYFVNRRGRKNKNESIKILIHRL